MLLSSEQVDVNDNNAQVRSVIEHALSLNPQCLPLVVSRYTGFAYWWDMFTSLLATEGLQVNTPRSGYTALDVSAIGLAQLQALERLLGKHGIISATYQKFLAESAKAISFDDFDPTVDIQEHIKQVRAFLRMRRHIHTLLLANGAHHGAQFLALQGQPELFATAMYWMSELTYGYRQNGTGQDRVRERYDRRR